MNEFAEDTTAGALMIKWLLRARNDAAGLPVANSACSWMQILNLAVAGHDANFAAYPKE